MSRCRINKRKFERKEEARSVFTSRGSRLCLPTALWQAGLGRKAPSASPHPPTHMASPAASRGNAPGRTWKDLEGPYASGRAAHTAPRPGWLAAPLILVRFLPTRGLRQVCDGGLLPSGLGVAGFPSGGCPWDSASVSALRVTAPLATWLARVSTPGRRRQGWNGSR